MRSSTLPGNAVQTVGKVYKSVSRAAQRNTLSLQWETRRTVMSSKEVKVCDVYDEKKLKIDTKDDGEDCRLYDNIQVTSLHVRACVSASSALLPL